MLPSVGEGHCSRGHLAHPGMNGENIALIDPGRFLHLTGRRWVSRFGLQAIDGNTKPSELPSFRTWS